MRKPHSFNDFRAIASSLTLNGVAGLILFALNFVLAKYYDSEDVGRFLLMFNLLLVLSGFSRIGYDNALVKYIAIARTSNDIQKVSGLYRQALLTSVLISLAIGLFFFLLSGPISLFVFDDKSFAVYLKYLGISLTPFTINIIHAYCFQGSKNHKAAIFFLHICVPLGFLISVFFVREDSVESLALIAVFVCIIAAIISLISFFTYGINLKYKLESDMKTEFKRTALEIFPTSILFLILQWSPPILIAFWMDYSEVAVFSIAFRAATLMVIVLVAINVVFTPRFSELFEQKKMAEVEAIAKKSVKILFFFACPMLIVFWLCDEWILSLFGSEYIIGSTAFIILLFGQFVNVCTGSVGGLLQMTGYQKLFTLNMSVAVVILFLLSIILIPHYGVTGAAIASAVALSVQNILGVFWVKQKLGFNLLKIY